MEINARTYVGDCLDLLEHVPPRSVDLAYFDPPFFTQKVHQLATRNGDEAFSFDDMWDGDRAYMDFIYKRLDRVREALKPSGSVFFHCDKSAAHMIRLMLDRVFSPANFQAEIVWHFKRWSNSKKGLLPAHQTIYFYSKTSEFKFNRCYQEYSPATNIDQIMQKRTRDHRNKSVYARDEEGNVMGNGGKKGVPLSDVWEIPFLNPKAKERVGYPTQKPVILMNRIIELATDEGDVVLDPFCGSGTTLVAAQLLGRTSIGIDVSAKAIELTQERLANPVVTDSVLLRKGRRAYRQNNAVSSSHLAGIEYLPIRRNRGIDGLLKKGIGNRPTFIRVQRTGETVAETVAALRKAAKNKGQCSLVVVATRADPCGHPVPAAPDVHVIPSTSLSLSHVREGQMEALHEMGAGQVAAEVEARS